MWRKLMGSTRLGVRSISETVRLHAACDNRFQNGSVALAFANPSKDSVRLDLGGVGNRTIVHYTFSAPDGNLSSRSVLVNGVPMEDPAQGLSVAGKEVRADRLVLEAFSYGFIVDLDAGARACQVSTPSAFVGCERSEGAARMPSN